MELLDIPVITKEPTIKETMEEKFEEIYEKEIDDIQLIFGKSELDESHKNEIKVFFFQGFLDGMRLIQKHHGY